MTSDIGGNARISDSRGEIRKDFKRKVITVLNFAKVK